MLEGRSSEDCETQKLPGLLEDLMIQQDDSSCVPRTLYADAISLPSQYLRLRFEACLPQLDGLLTDGGQFRVNSDVIRHFPTMAELLQFMLFRPLLIFLNLVLPAPRVRPMTIFPIISSTAVRTSPRTRALRQERFEAHEAGHDDRHAGLDC